MFDPLFDIYQNVESRKELWDFLKAKYIAEDASSKKFLVSIFTNYKINNSSSVMEQYNELLGMLGRFTQHKMNMDEAIQVSCIIDKLSLSWIDFKHNLKYNKELTLVELGSHLGIEESFRAHNSDKPNGNNVAGPQVWGCRAVVRLPDTQLKTLGERGIECIFVGYAEHSKVFRFYVIEPNDSVLTNSIIELKDSIFDENRLSSVPRPIPRIPNVTKDIDGSVVPKEVTKEVYDQHSYCFNVEDDPKTFDEAMKSRDVAFWKEAINDEMDSIMGNHLGVGWSTSSSIRLPIAMALIHNLIIHQMDVKTAFLNGDLDEEGLKQAPKKFDETGKGVIICLYVDDMLIFGTDQVQVDMTKEFLSSRFSIKDMEEADVILVSTPIDTSEKLMPNNSQAVSQLEYSRLIGCLMYAMTYARPDIAFAGGKLSRYTSNPVLEGYTDASWIRNTEDNSSTSGWVFLLGGGAIFLAFNKQTCITGSTMESKFVALVAAGKEAKWLKNLLLEIPLCSKPITPISNRCNSAATLAKTYSQMYNEKYRYLGVRHNMIRELNTNRLISIEFVRSQ
uniref:Retroviral polymerase SH3-like domain-containing protein n=1 Tax=Tanacetum cinerariifolium TaxID=118510 RepID=A0A699HP19_TANCI|nr:hypothetical protein [Tanacetum cinerariifolium]